jgi:ParB-like nuclease domain.
MSNADQKPEVPPRPDEILPDERIQYQAMTELTNAEYATLAADIRENGVLQPVIVDDSDEQKIIDGHHREAVAVHYDLPESKQPAYVVLTGSTETEKVARAIKQNLIGRDTTNAVKSHAVRQYIETVWDRTDDGALIRPETDSEVASKLGVSEPAD